MYVCFSTQACVQKSECKNGGTCIDGQCVCSKKFGGSHCEGKSIRIVFGISCQSKIEQFLYRK